MTASPKRPPAAAAEPPSRRGTRNRGVSAATPLGSAEGVRPPSPQEVPLPGGRHGKTGRGCVAGGGTKAVCPGASPQSLPARDGGPHAAEPEPARKGHHGCPSTPCSPSSGPCLQRACQTPLEKTNPLRPPSCCAAILCTPLGSLHLRTWRHLLDRQLLSKVPSPRPQGPQRRGFHQLTEPHRERHAEATHLGVLRGTRKNPGHPRLSHRKPCLDRSPRGIPEQEGEARAGADMPCHQAGCRRPPGALGGLRWMFLGR
ncbi:proline-rich proteoglycan 2-like [Camelus ferus]|uniref:Proline-rich proteoglycan 2-like n=1 Tax=Camelus ferus TaxID=419612 RepID=A0A8B8T2U3_CAMFR|nr:proline-rich proteoglycan 2-like [Camelus ferus]